MAKKVVGVERFELPTSCSQSKRATRLRYTPTGSFFLLGLSFYWVFLRGGIILRSIGSVNARQRW